MDITSILNDMVTSGLGLSLVGGAFVLWWLSGRIPNLFSEKKWSWKRGLEDLCKALLMGVLLVAGTGLLNLGGQFFAILGWDITEATQDVSTYVLAGAMAWGFVNYMSKALKNGWAFFNLVKGEFKGNKEQFDKGSAIIGEYARETVKEIADKLTPKHTIDECQTDELAPLEEGAVEVGQGVDINPLSRRLPDGDNCNGAGWQCSKYSWYLGSGIVMHYAPNPDFGPCNGNAMVDYLINKLGWAKCNKINGAIFSYNAGEYGHTGMVVDAANNIVNDANWDPLRVSTHYLNLDAVGAVYCCPKSMLESTPTPAPTPAPKPQPAKPDNKPTKKNPTVKYTYRPGDTFGQVILDLGLSTNHGLWRSDGDVAYYTNQLHEQGIWGNIPVGTTIELTPRV